MTIRVRELPIDERLPFLEGMGWEWRTMSNVWYREATHEILHPESADIDWPIIEIPEEAEE